MESGSTWIKRLKNGKNGLQSLRGRDYALARDPEPKTAHFVSPAMLSRLITGVSGKPPKLCAQKAEKFPELLGEGDAPRV